MDLELARNFLIALLIGAFVGVEREKKKDAEPGHSFGGIRTHILLALLGAASAWLARTLAMPWVFVATLALVGAAVIASYWQQNRETPEALGLTSEFAAMAVCLLGAMVVVGEAALAVALGVVTSAVLAYKQPLHGIVQRIGEADLYAGIKLLIASFIVLPLLPDETIDPWGAINPYKLWLMVILISGLSLLGYVAVRWFGSAHGAAITGIAGGLASSTATTLGFARSARDEHGAAGAHALSAGILLAWLVMFVRVLVLVAVVNLALLRSMWPPFAAMGVVTAGFALWHYRAGSTSQAKDSSSAVHNPFSLGAAIRFGAVFALILLAVKITQQHLPEVGLGVVAALGGSVDVDAITLTLAGDSRDAAQHGNAGRAIAIAALANTVVKCVLVWVYAQGPVRRQMSIATAAILGAGVAVLLLR